LKSTETLARARAGMARGCFSNFGSLKSTETACTPSTFCRCAAPFQQFRLVEEH